MPCRSRIAPIIRAALLYALLIALSSIILVPLVWSVSASFTPLNVIFANAVPFSDRSDHPCRAALCPPDCPLQHHPGPAGLERLRLVHPLERDLCQCRAVLGSLRSSVPRCSMPS